jgi:hypothetical protein
LHATVLGGPFLTLFYGLRAAHFDSNFLQNIANRATRQQTSAPKVSGNGVYAAGGAFIVLKARFDNPHPLGHRPRYRQELNKRESRDKRGCRAADPPRRSVREDAYFVQ